MRARDDAVLCVRVRATAGVFKAVINDPTLTAALEAVVVVVFIVEIVVFIVDIETILRQTLGVAVDRIACHATP